MVERLLGWLRDELGDDLLDVDLMVVIAPGLDATGLKWGLAPRLEEIADEEGDSPVWYSVLFTLAQHAQAARKGGDYEAVKPSWEEAQRYVAGAADFIAAVERMLDAD